MTNTYIPPIQKSLPMGWYRSNILPTTNPHLLTPTTYNPSKPKPPAAGTLNTKANLYSNTSYSTTPAYHGLLSHRTYNILYLLRSNPNPNTNPYHTVGKPTRAPKRWHLLPPLHSYQFSPPASCPPILTLTDRHPPPSYLKAHPSPPILHISLPLILPPPKHRTTHSFHSKSPPIWPAPLTTKSPRGGPNCRINVTRCPPPKARRIRHHTYHSPNKHTPKQPPPLPIYHPRPLRSTNNQLNLPTPN